MNKHWRINKVGNALTKLKNAAKFDLIHRKAPSLMKFQGGNMNKLLHDRPSTPSILGIQHRRSSTVAEQSQSASRASVSASVAAAHNYAKNHSALAGFGSRVLGMSMRERERVLFATFPTRSNDKACEISESIQNDLMPIDNDTKHLLALMNYKPNIEIDTGKGLHNVHARQALPHIGTVGHLRLGSKFAKYPTAAIRLIPTDKMTTIGQADWHQSVRDSEWRGKQAGKANKNKNQKMHESKSRESVRDSQLTDDRQNYKKYLRFYPKASGNSKRFDEIYLKEDETPMRATSASQQLLAQDTKLNKVKLKLDGSQKATKIKKHLTYHDIVLEKKNKELMSMLAKKTARPKQKSANVESKRSSEPKTKTKEKNDFLASKGGASALDLGKKSESKTKSWSFRNHFMHSSKKPQLSGQGNGSSEHLAKTTKFSFRKKNLSATDSKPKLKGMLASQVIPSLAKKTSSRFKEYFRAM